MNKTEFFDHLIEISQAQANFNSLYNRNQAYQALQAANAISPKDKYNLQMDVKKVKSDISQLQDTAAGLPDDFVDTICDDALSYPLDEPIDEDKELTTWCNEVDEFLNQDLNSWGSIKKSY